MNNREQALGRAIEFLRGSTMVPTTDQLIDTARAIEAYLDGLPTTAHPYPQPCPTAVNGPKSGAQTPAGPAPTPIKRADW